MPENVFHAELLQRYRDARQKAAQATHDLHIAQHIADEAGAEYKHLRSLLTEDERRVCASENIEVVHRADLQEVVDRFCTAGAGDSDAIGWLKLSRDDYLRLQFAARRARESRYDDC